MNRSEPATTEGTSLREWTRLAEKAWERGRAEAGAGRLDEALRWLDRASRLAPTDDTVKLTLAMVCLARQEPRAVRLLEEVVARNDVREAWMGLAAARRLSRDAAGAAAALGEALTRSLMMPDAAAVAEAIAREAGMPGWCGVSSDGVLRWGLSNQEVLPEIALDGRALPVSPQPRSASLPLPAEWRCAEEVSIRLRGRHLIGSPVRLGAIARVEGVVEAHAGGLRGWAWHPGDPERDPVLSVSSSGRVRFRWTATDTETESAGRGLLARPRAFQVPREALARISGEVRVCGEDGRDLLGSPIHPVCKPRRSAARVAEPAMRATPAPIVRRRRETDVVVPVHGNREKTLACLDSVFTTVPAGARVIVVDDCSPDRTLRAALDDLVKVGRIRLIRHGANRGFPASANAGLRAAGRRDAVLLNSDTLVPPHWLARLREAAYSAAEIGTVSPLSNDAAILSYPDASGGNAVPDLAGTARLASLAHRANAGVVVDVPTTVGFCMYIRRDCLDAVGLLREDSFAQGYGEENDFCLRGRRLGWRHVAVPGVFVAHVGGQSFGGGRAHLMARNAAVLERLHPGYERRVAAFIAADPLANARRRLDLLDWRAARVRPVPRAAILITHDQGGGVEHAVAAQCERLRGAGIRPIVLRPVAGAARTRAVLLSDGVAGGFPNLRFTLPDEMRELMRLVKAERPGFVVLHHLLGHHPAVLQIAERLGVAYEVQVHDYAWFCPRVSLAGLERRYCGEPDAAHCDACVSEAGRIVEEEIPVSALRQRSAALLSGARRVVTPSADCAGRIHRHFPRVRPEVIAPETDGTGQYPKPVFPGRSGVRRICVVGGIGIEKGYEVLLACARDVAMRALPLEFVVVGHTVDDAQLMSTGRVFVTGRYESVEAVSLIRAQCADLVFLPSIVPETWCFTLSEAWRAGLDVVAFDIGAQAERIRRAGRGFLLPLGLSTAAVNNALLAEATQIRHECSAAVSAA